MKEFRYINYSHNKNHVMIRNKINQSTKQMEEVL